MLLSLLVTSALAGEDPNFYGLVGVGTTVMYVPNAGPVDGPLGDVSPTLAFGWMVTPKIALELDAGLTFAGGGYAATGVGPSIVWAVHPNAYLAGRVFVPVHPSANLVLIPSAGVCYAFGPVAPYLELGVASAVGRGQPDLAVVPSAGVSVYF